MVLSEQAIELKQEAILQLVKQWRGQLVLKTAEYIVFTASPLSEESITELEQYGEVNITDKEQAWHGSVVREQYEVHLQDG